LGYCLLALASWHGLGWNKKRWWIAWVIAILYAILMKSTNLLCLVGQHCHLM
jgi:hypothetical protein